MIQACALSQGIGCRGLCESVACPNRRPRSCVHSLPDCHARAVIAEQPGVPPVGSSAGLPQRLIPSKRIDMHCHLTTSSSSRLLEGVFLGVPQTHWSQKTLESSAFARPLRFHPGSHFKKIFHTGVALPWPCVSIRTADIKQARFDDSAAQRRWRSPAGRPEGRRGRRRE